MSSVRTKKKISRALFRSFPFLLFLFCCFSGFIIVLLFIVKTELQNFCKNDIESRLQGYLQERSSGPLLVKGDKLQKSGLHGLSFIRLISENEQVFYAEKSDSALNLQGIVNLDPHLSAVWIALDDGKKPGIWNVASAEIENGLVVQVGMQFEEIITLYHRLRLIAIFAGIAAFFLSSTIVIFINKRGKKLLQLAEQALAKIVNEQKGGLLQIGVDEELADLYQLLNRLITQNRQLIEEMQNSLDNVAHDLRTPMTRLRSVAEYGLQQNTPERLSEALSDCLEESERVLSMLTIMMSVVEAESGTMVLKKAAVQLLSTIRDVVCLYEYVADEKKIRLSVDVDPSLVVEADKTRITQVWANIVDNAIKYGKEGGFVTISARQDGDALLVVSFLDDGMGISEHEQPRIWERLFRGDRSRTQQGLGLGLNYVKAVVEAHGGKVAVVSKRGEGARFEVYLPLDQGEL